jgi:outer membrane lipoprotein SlyB
MRSVLVRSSIVAGALSALLAVGCSSSPPREERAYTNPGSVSTTSVDRYAHYGRVTRIDTVQADRRSVGVGTVLGAVVGGALGNQVGSGSGRTAATIGGAVAGGVVGNQVENRNRNEVSGYEVHVRLENGDSRVITVADTGGLEVGERIRLEGSNIVRL